MARYMVYGKALVDVQIEVEAEDREEALEMAYNTLDDLEAYAGNGGMDKIVGVDLEEAAICPNGIEYEDVEYLGESEEEENDD